MSHTGACITNGATNNSVVILQKPVHQRTTNAGDETEDDSEDDTKSHAKRQVSCDSEGHATSSGMQEALVACEAEADGNGCD